VHTYTTLAIVITSIVEEKKKDVRKKRSEGNLYTSMLETSNKGKEKKRVFVDINYFLLILDFEQQ
jgi:hypothetical protein